MWVIEIAVADDCDHVITDLYATSRPTLLAGLLKKAPLKAVSLQYFTYMIGQKRMSLRSCSRNQGWCLCRNSNRGNNSARRNLPTRITGKVKRKIRCNHSRTLVLVCPAL